MSYYYLVCTDCDYEFTVPTSSGDPFQHVCPKCASKNLCQRFGVVNTKCIDLMKECSNCPFENNCSAQ